MPQSTDRGRSEVARESSIVQGVRPGGTPRRCIRVGGRSANPALGEECDDEPHDELTDAETLRIWRRYWVALVATVVRGGGERAAVACSRSPSWSSELLCPRRRTPRSRELSRKTLPLTVDFGDGPTSRSSWPTSTSPARTAAADDAPVVLDPRDAFDASSPGVEVIHGGDGFSTGSPRTRDVYAIEVVGHGVARRRRTRPTPSRRCARFVVEPRSARSG